MIHLGCTQTIRSHPQGGYSRRKGDPFARSVKIHLRLLGCSDTPNPTQPNPSQHCQTDDTSEHTLGYAPTRTIVYDPS